MIYLIGLKSSDFLSIQDNKGRLKNTFRRPFHHQSPQLDHPPPFKLPYPPHRHLGNTRHVSPSCLYGEGKGGMKAQFRFSRSCLWAEYTLKKQDNCKVDCVGEGPTKLPFALSITPI